MRLQNAAKEETYLSINDAVKYRSMLINQNLGGSYHLGYITDKLMKLGLDLRSSDTTASIEHGFFRRLVRYAM
jgi:hypothetical protein